MTDTTVHTDPHAELITLAEAFRSVELTKGQAGLVLNTLANQLRDADPGINTAFINASTKLLYPDDAPKSEDPPASFHTRTSRSAKDE